jgi:DNA-binding transcriptional LysR family regulator
MIGRISKRDNGLSLMNLDITQLRAFVAVAEHKSFSKASQKLFRVQSAISQQIQKLENTLGTELFVRDRRGLQLTARGDTMLAYAMKILEINDQAVITLTGESPKGLVRVGTSDTYASRFFSDILKACSVRFPDIEIEVHCGYSSQLWLLYEANEIDVVLTQGCPSSISSELLYSEPLAWVCSRDSSIFSQDPVPLALFTKGCGDRDLTLSALNRAKKNYRINYHSTSHAGIVAAVSSGCYVSAILVSTADCELRILGEADSFPILGNLDISLAYHDKTQSAPMSLFADIARSYFRSLSTVQIGHRPEPN